MDDVIVNARNLSKVYKLYDRPIDRLIESLSPFGTKYHKEFYALKDISFEIKRGGSFGLVGKNGSGKSTLLKIITGVLSPTSGHVYVNGKISALLELGAGFNPEMTGIENIYISGTIMGYTKDEMDKKLESILSFADIGDFIHQPVKMYSSGMFARLAFAVAINVEPDLLIVDEVLAVGDEAFQKKCIRWMESYLSNGGTLMLCSHSMYHIQKLCSKALWLKDGEARLYGDAMDVTQEYLAYFEEIDNNLKAKSVDDEMIEHKAATSDEVYSMLAVHMEDSNGRVVSEVRHGDDVYVKGRIYSPDGRPPVAAIGILKVGGVPVYATSSELDGFKPYILAGTNQFGFTLHFKRLPLLPGRYILRAHAMDPEAMRLFDPLEYPFKVFGNLRDMGVCYLEHAWQGESQNHLSWQRGGFHSNKNSNFYNLSKV